MRDHHCEVCGVYACHGFAQKGGAILWYCLKHRLEGHKTPNPAPPPPELKGQLSLFGEPKGKK
jgi:hypothetical protein